MQVKLAIRGISFFTGLYLLIVMAGCVHRIHVNPVPETTASQVLPFSVNVEVPFLALEGADHMPGITLLEWPRQDLQTAIVDYLRKRGVFAAVETPSPDMVLTVRGWLTLRAPDRYVYFIHLEADMKKFRGPIVESYAADSRVEGSRVRWTTETDRQPIQAAVRQALDRLLAAIEADGSRLTAAHPS